MHSNDYYVLGIMSGTSVDGVDFAYAKFSKNKTWSFEIINAETIPYTEVWQKNLREAINYQEDKLKDFDLEYTQLLAKMTQNFLKKYGIKELDAICSHGHTIIHQPAQGITYQIGNQQLLAKITGFRVICDFRVQDVKLGGQGAPLVPIGDDLLFAEYDFCLNIGGFANISFNEGDKRIAYDICATNIVLNHYCELMNLQFDDNGKIAATHDIDKNLLKKLNNLPFYAENPPKSLGLEWVNKNIFPLIDSFKLKPSHVISTFTEHMANQIAATIKKHSKTDAENKILITGGGAFNGYLVNRINTLSKAEIIIPDREIIEFKEALIFGFMGVLRMRNSVNVLSSVTGAAHDHCSGVIFLV
ncbi:MAG: anhydro-N-acetylmuramic acid kinase [Leeuwenhoekiella sp.]